MVTRPAVPKSRGYRRRTSCCRNATEPECAVAATIRRGVAVTASQLPFFPSNVHTTFFVKVRIANRSMGWPRPRGEVGRSCIPAACRGSWRTVTIARLARARDRDNDSIGVSGLPNVVYGL